MKNRVKAAFSGVVLAAAFTLFAVEPAAAAFTDCTFGQGCTWTGSNGTGTRTSYAFSASGGKGVCNTISRTVRSAYNTYGGGVQGFALFETSNCSGGGVFIPTGNAVNFGSPFAMHSYKIL